MHRFASSLAAIGLALALLLSVPARANAGVLSGVGHVVTGAGGALLSVGKGALCKGLSAAGTVAVGAGTVGGAAVGGAATEGGGTAAGAAAGGAAGGVLKKGAGLVQKVVCSSGGGATSTLAKAAVGAVATAATFDLASHWMIAAATKITAAIVSMVTSTTSPQLTAAWFQRSFAPMVALGGALALLVTLIALTSAAARRDPAALAGTLTGILRAGVGTGLLVALTTLALQISDAISADVIRSSHQTFWSQVGQAWGLSGFGGFGSSALAMLMAVIQVIAGVIVWLELAVRNAAIYLAVLFLPVALAASIWPNLAGWTSRLARLLFLFVILKPVTLIVLAFAGNAALAGLSLNGSLAASTGTIIAAITIFALAAMAPWALMLIVAADAESAAIGAGVRSAAGHARTDGAATLGRVGGRVRSGVARASGALGAAGGTIRGAASGRGGGGSSGSGGSSGDGGGGGRPPGPAGDSPAPPGGGPAPQPNGDAAPASAPTRRPARTGGAAGATSGAVPRGAVALAAGLTASSAAGTRGQQPGRTFSDTRTGWRSHASPVAEVAPIRSEPTERRHRKCGRAALSRPGRHGAAEAAADPAGRDVNASALSLAATQFRRGGLMSSDGHETTYRFAPHPSAGFILGLRIPQLIGLVVAGALALVSLRTGGFGGFALAIAVAGLVASLVMVPVRGQTVEQWAPILVRFLMGRGQSRFRAQTALVGHVVRLPSGQLDPQPVEPPHHRPSEIGDIELLECELSAYSRALLGVAKDRRAGTYTAAVRVQCRAFELLSPDERQQRLEEYGGVLAALARDDSPLRRIAWVERALPGDPDALGGYLLEAKRPDASLDDPPYELVSYLRLIGRAGHVAEEHELLFAVQIDARRPAARRPVARLGGGDLGAVAVLAGEIGRLIELLDGAGVTPTGVLTRRGLAAAIRDGYDPWGRRQRHRDQDPAAEYGAAPTLRRPPLAMSTGRTFDRMGRCIARCGWPNGRGSTSAPFSFSRCSCERTPPALWRFAWSWSGRPGRSARPNGR